MTIQNLKKILLVCLVMYPAALPAQDAEINAAVEQFAEKIISIRRHLHRNPELSNREFETARLVADHLTELGIDVETGIAYTGVVGVLRGGQPGPVVAVRADMDALPVVEDTPFPFRSTVRTNYLGQDVGVSHACGHDIHTSVLLGVASVLAELRDDLPGTVKFIFQPAEEGPPLEEGGGAKMMLEQGAFGDPRPEAVFGLHTLAELEVGTVGFTAGQSLASADRFDVTIKGRQAHGASPHQSIDPIVMASQAVMALQTIRSRNLDPLEPSVVTVGIFRSGERYNIIPAEVFIEGTVRTFEPRVRDEIERRMKEILDGITQAYGGSYELNYHRIVPAVYNDPELYEKMWPTVQRAVGEEHALIIPRSMVYEDFSFFANEVPGFFFRLGMVKPGTTSGGHHTPTFLADDSAIPVGMRTMANLLWDYLVLNGNK
jgi:amidohydrolase